MRLEAIDLNVGYDAAHVSQRHISFSLESGQVCCVLGPNGCGKSTLFNTLLGYLPPRSGKAVIDRGQGQENIHDMSAHERADVMAYVTQNHQPPFPYETHDVVEMGLVNRVGFGGRLSANDQHLVDEAMQELGIWDLRDEIYTQLSGGELQLVMIARALVQQPDFILMDEPTAALDYGNEIRVIEQVRKLRDRGIGVLMTTHDPDHAFLLDADVVLLAKDQPMLKGNCRDVLTDDNVRKAYGTEVYRVQYETRNGKRMYLCVPDI